MFVNFVYILYISFFQVMPISLNPGVRTLILKYNAFHSVDASFNFYPGLELVDLSHNGIVSVPARAFSSQRALQDLRLNDNKISALSSESFQGLRRLKSLELRKNFVNTLPANFLADLESLEILDLGKNLLGEISPEAFRGLSQLRVLKLDDNNLEKVPAGLELLTGLVELHLNRNKIRVIPDRSLLLPTLSFLDVGSNNLERIHEKGLDEMGTLRTLKLQDNNLYEVPSSALAPLSSLETLFIGQNMFERIQPASFSSLPRLRRLDISGCPALTTIENHAFTANPDLREVTIASNKKLATIGPDAFAGVPDLERVDLSSNALEALPASLLQWSRLHHLQVSGNPLHCDCNNAFLKDVIYNVVNSSEAVRVVRCWSPVHLRDQDLALLDLQCDVTSSSRIENSDILTVIIVATIVSVFLVVSLLLLFVRLRRGKLTSHVPVKDKDILQYEEAEPRYVSPYLVKTNILCNPYQDTLVRTQDTLVRHDQYFATLARLDPHYADQATVYTDQPTYKDRAAFADQRTYGRRGGPVYRDHHQIYADPNVVSNVGTLVRINPSSTSSSHYEDPISVL